MKELLQAVFDGRVSMITITKRDGTLQLACFTAKNRQGFSVTFEPDAIDRLDHGCEALLEEIDRQSPKVQESR